jgi:hypothetical protein
VKFTSTHEARKALFQIGLRRGHLTLAEIDGALPAGSLSPAERWLLLYSLRAAGVDIRDDRGEVVAPGDPPAPGPPGDPV